MALLSNFMDEYEELPIFGLGKVLTVVGFAELFINFYFGLYMLLKIVIFLVLVFAINDALVK
tara:strand:+ start:901 stop:1086 length:186 start_codon:yes stop_codon:yes gene_type:complete